MPDPACCFCDEVFGTWKALAEHLVETACGRRTIETTVGGGVTAVRRLTPTGNPRGAYLKACSLICWCGRKFNFTYRKLRHSDTAWAAHMREVGGLARHILELTLGTAR